MISNVETAYVALRMKVWMCGSERALVAVAAA
jgi:hypothetical protein